MRLFRKDSWNDLHGIAEIVAGLREEQRIYEEQLLDAETEADGQALAYRLIALYHWAKATELLSKFMLQGKPTGIAEQLDRNRSAGDVSPVQVDAAILGA